MPSPDFTVILRKDLRELQSSRAFWILLVIIGPLVGHGFITAVNSYAEMSGIGGGPSALAQGLTPLDGILVPTLGAYDLAATFLFPFVAIRMIAAERESGAWKLLLQSRVSVMQLIASKAVALLMAWIISLVPGIVAIALWRAYGGHIHWPEMWNLLLGHALRVGISGSVAVAAAACIPGAANAAIVTLAFTLGTWALEFVAQGRGGMLETLASFTPTAALRSFEQGQLKFSVVIVLSVMTFAGFAIAAEWMKLTLRRKQQATATIVIVVLCAVVGAAASNMRAARDVSEDRRNSFSLADEAALATIKSPIHITVNLAPEDPRLMDLQRNILSKLRRIIPDVTVTNVSASRTGLFSGNDEHYGEIWYESDGKKLMSRSTTEQIVLETIYSLTGVAAPKNVAESTFAGHPLAARPKYAELIFYLLWPVVVILTWWLNRR